MLFSVLGRQSARRFCCALIALVMVALISSPAWAAMKTANWTGGGAAGSYNDPLNWDIGGGKIPIDDGTDTYTVNIDGGVTVNFDVPGTGHQIFQFNLPATSTFRRDFGHRHR